MTQPFMEPNEPKKPWYKKWYILVPVVLLLCMAVVGLKNSLPNNPEKAHSSASPTPEVHEGSFSATSRPVVKILPLQEITGTAMCMHGEPVSGVWLEVRDEPSSPSSGFASFGPRDASRVTFVRHIPKNKAYRVNVGCGYLSPRDKSEWLTDNKGPWVAHTVTVQNLKCNSKQLTCTRS